MDEKEIINNMKVLIKKLQEENNVLKDKLTEKEVAWNILMTENEEKYKKLDESILTTSLLIKEYKQLNSELKEIKNKYTKGVRDIYKLKKQYEIESANIIDALVGD